MTIQEDIIAVCQPYLKTPTTTDTFKALGEAIRAYLRGLSRYERDQIEPYVCSFCGMQPTLEDSLVVFLDMGDSKNVIVTNRCTDPNCPGSHFPNVDRVKTPKEKWQEVKDA